MKSLDKLQEDDRVLSEAERRGYQRLVGSLLWIGGLRHDVAYALAYLSGFGRIRGCTHEREWRSRYWSICGGRHHLHWSWGGGELEIAAFSDSSHQNGREGWSVNGTL
jgi:hypothetical protein